VGEQSNTLRILLRNDRKSRHRRIKKLRRYERLAATSQFLGTDPNSFGVFYSPNYLFFFFILIKLVGCEIKKIKKKKMRRPQKKMRPLSWGSRLYLKPERRNSPFKPTPYQSLRRAAFSFLSLSIKKKKRKEREIRKKNALSPADYPYSLDYHPHDSKHAS
jgi:hypothetical protein